MKLRLSKNYDDKIKTKWFIWQGITKFRWFAAFWFTSPTAILVRRKNWKPYLLPSWSKQETVNGFLISYILKQIPNATSNTFLNISKPTECRLTPFKSWLDKCVRHSMFEFERSAWFHARAFAFCLMVSPVETNHKKKAENNLFQFCFTLCKCFMFVILGCFTTLRWLKVLKLSKICFKMVKTMTPKINDQNILFLNERIPFNLHCGFNECGIKLKILINNCLWINLVNTRYLRPWYAKHKMSRDDSSQKIGRNVYLKGTVMH